MKLYHMIVGALVVAGSKDQQRPTPKSHLHPQDLQSGSYHI
jgi:hypothetical protein